MEINNAVRRWFKYQGLTQAEAAERLGVQEQAVSTQLVRHFSANSARRWAVAFGLNEKFLLTGNGPICNRNTSYQKMVLETESLHSIIQSQKRTIEEQRLKIEKLKEENESLRRGDVMMLAVPATPPRMPAAV
jgi:transcriptional regulator with XRE-family HTH domain